MALELWTLLTSSARAVDRRAARAEESGWHGLAMTDSQNLAGDVWVALATATAVTESIGLSPGSGEPMPSLMTSSTSAR